MDNNADRYIVMSYNDGEVIRYKSFTELYKANDYFNQLAASNLYNIIELSQEKHDSIDTFVVNILRTYED